MAEPRTSATPAGEGDHRWLLAIGGSTRLDRQGAEDGAGCGDASRVAPAVPGTGSRFPGCASAVRLPTFHAVPTVGRRGGRLGAVSTDGLFELDEPAAGDPGRPRRSGLRRRWPCGCARAPWTRWSARRTCCGPGAPLRRLVEGGAAASVLLYGPPGTGKTTIARLLARRCGERHFVALSALSSGVKELRAGHRRRPPPPRLPRPADRAVHRRGAPLLQDPAGRAARRRRGPAGAAGRRDHREPVVLGGVAAAVALAGAAAAVAHRGRRARAAAPGGGRPARARRCRRAGRRGRGRAGPAGRRRRPPRADRAGGRRRRGRGRRRHRDRRGRRGAGGHRGQPCATTGPATSTTT